MTSKIFDAANALLDARRTVKPIADLPNALRPTSEDEAFAVQDQMMVAYGEIGGWKVGSPAPGATPVCAPMPRAWMAPDAPVLAAPHFRYRGLEAELAFRIGENLPPRATFYTLDEVKAAIASAHPAIEVLESAFLEPAEASRFSTMADLQNHGGFVYGPAMPDWQSIRFEGETATIAVDGSIRAEHTASAAGGDFLYSLLLWLANEGAARTGGLRAGQFVTTGSWTGVTRTSSNSTVDARFTTIGSVSLRFT
jgi:2-keto-4-pentenoate hydratase